MKNLPQIASLLYTAPWAILPDVHSQLGQSYRAYVNGESLEPFTALQTRRTEKTDSRYYSDSSTGLAVVPINGIIGKRFSWFDLLCLDVCDLTHLDDICIELLDRPDIDTVVFDLNTPGGCSIGLVETASHIRDLAENGKRTIAYTDYQCCSAGYWLAAACDEIVAAPSAMIGSISTYIAAVDSSRAWEMQGLNLKLFRSGSLKAIGHPGKQWTEEEENYMQDLVDQHGTDFRAWIQSRRPAITDEQMQGQWWEASRAGTAIVDAYARNLDELLESLITE